MRDTIFIGHANPEDNEFTLWLYHKLSNEGYKVACDLVDLTGGEADFWKTLQDILENHSVKYLLIFSKKTFTKQGVIDEWEQVRSISKRIGIKDFIYLLKIDDVPFDQRIGTVTMNQFRFDQSWAGGLRKLTKKMHLDQVPKGKSNLSINNWLKNRFTNLNAGLLKRPEKHHSNWVEIISLPKTLWIYQYSNSSQADAILNEIDDLPIIRHDNYLLTFITHLPTEIMGKDFKIEPKHKVSFSTDKCFNYFDAVEFPGFHDSRRFLVRLLKKAFSIYFNNLGLMKYGLSSKTDAYYYFDGQRPDNRVNFEFEGKKTRKDLVGKYYEDYWHYAISVRPIFNPYFAFSIKGHLVFSSDGIKHWADKKKLQSARKNKGKRFFNKEWRDMLIAFLYSLNEEGDVINLPASEVEFIKIQKEPMFFISNVGYDDPKDKAREVPIDFYEDDDDEKENLDSEFNEEESNL